MLLALGLEGVTLLAHAGAQAVAIGGSRDAAFPLLEDGDAGPVILGRQGAGFGEHLQALRLGEPRSSTPGWLWSAALGMDGTAQTQHQRRGDQGTGKGKQAWHGERFG